MPIITISHRGSTRSIDVAERVAAKLGYPCIARSVIQDASEEFDVPEGELLKATRGGRSVLGPSREQRRHLAYLKATLLKHFESGDIVYHGLLGHYVLPGIPNILKVRVLDHIDLRIEEVMKRDGVTAPEARARLEENDRAHRNWVRATYGVDPSDSEVYDLIIHVGRVSADYAADVICTMAKLPAFEPSPGSSFAIEDLALTAAVEVALIDLEEGLDISARDGRVIVKATPRRIRAGTSREFYNRYRDDLERRIRQLTRGLPGLVAVDVQIVRPA